MILNICGCSGSGKTTLVRQLMEKLNASPIQEDEKDKPEVYRLDHEIYVLGRYTPGLQSAGVDTFKSLPKVERLVYEWAGQGHVIFEGLFTSSVWKRWSAIAQELDGFTWVFLNTPEDRCYARVLGRQNRKPAKRENITEKWKRNERYRVRALEAGFTVRDIRHDHALEDLLAILQINPTSSAQELGLL